ncbi:MAG: thiamine pyrophosphate-dependent dehydrogenase E1 component subunit alpha [Natronomonas sp.]
MGESDMRETNLEISPDRQRGMLETMQRIRAFESRIQELFADGELPGFVHLYIGEEAIATGVCEALNDDDYITSTHRGHGHCIAKGHDFDRMMAELFGKETGYCGGKGGSMHIASPELNNLGANGIVGAGIPIGVGAALSSYLRGSGQVAVSFFGDGALAQGAFHEAMNLAALWDLPFVGVVENNQYGEMSGLEEQQAIEDLTARATSYGIPGIDVDGMDVEEVHAAATAAIEAAREGDGPTLLVCETYRFEGHHEGDTEFYRDDDEVNEWRERDPIDTYRERLDEVGALDDAVWRSMCDEIDAALEDAVDFARNSPFPETERAYENLYAEEV